MFAVTIKSSDTPFLLIGLPPGQFAMSSGGPPPGHPGLPMPQTRGPPPRGSAIGALLNQQRNMPPSTMAQALQDIQQEQVLKSFSLLIKPFIKGTGSLLIKPFIKGTGKIETLAHQHFVGKHVLSL